MFNHIPVEMGYSDLNTISDDGRYYIGPDGDRYPSITTVLSILSGTSLAEWRARVGEGEANRISKYAANRGTAVHEIIEKYLKNDSDYKLGVMPHIIASFNSVKPILDKRVGDIYGMETALYSDHLGIAGRVDCVCMFDGKLSIVDFKTSMKPKKRDWVKTYFLQESGYAVMWEERTKMPVTQLVTIISVDNEKPEVYIEHRDDWANTLIETIKKFKDQKEGLRLKGLASTSLEYCCQSSCESDDTKNYINYLENQLTEMRKLCAIRV